MFFKWIPEVKRFFRTHVKGKQTFFYLASLSNVKNGCPWQTKCPQSKTAEVCVCWFFLQSRIAEILIIAFLSWPIHFYETTGVFDSSIHIALPPESSVLLLSSPGTMIILRQRCKKTCRFGTLWANHATGHFVSLNTFDRERCSFFVQPWATMVA